jgi:hypothetical protein
MTLPTMPPADGGAWLWHDPERRGTVVVPGEPACIADLAGPAALYRPCGKPGSRYPGGYRCPEHAPAARTESQQQPQAGPAVAADTGRQDPAYADRPCALCGQRHAPCVFTAGSLYCIRPDCTNPHHRQPPEASPAPSQPGPGGIAAGQQPGDTGLVVTPHPQEKTTRPAPGQAGSHAEGIIP